MSARPSPTTAGSPKPQDRGIGAEQRYRGVRQVLAIELALNLVNATFKAALGLWTGSLAIAGDAVHSLMDGANNIVGLVVLRWAEAPPDDQHPYGHRKFETIAAAVVGVAVALVAGRLGWSAVDALIHGSAGPRVTSTGFLVLGVTLAINIFVALYERYQARRLQSEYLAADAAHTGSDVLVTILVITSVIGASFGFAWADPVGALIVTVVIARIAWLVLVRSMGPLVDTAIIDAADVSAVCMAVEGVRGCHRIRSRGTARFVHIDLHLLMDNELPLRSAHDTATEVELLLKKTYPNIVDVTIHLEPEEDGYESL